MALLRKSYEASLSELTRWQELTLSTDYEEARASADEMLKKLQMS
jgi:hypothetical protein